MKPNFFFFKTIMPDSRKADFYLGCLDGCVYLDFIITDDKRIKLCRISFDGYGCCNIGNKAKSLDYQLSKEFIEEIEKENLDQKNISKFVFKLIRLNEIYIWTDALVAYQLIDNE